MVRMGIDASTNCSGYCVFKGDKLITYGKLSPDNKADMTWRNRIIWMMKELAQIMREYSVEEVCIEVPIKTMRSITTMEKLFTLQGAVIGMAASMGVTVVPIEVATWRSFTGISKGILKDDKKHSREILKQRSIELVNQLYGLDLVWKSPSSKFNDDDISDSILICHTVVHR